MFVARNHSTFDHTAAIGTVLRRVAARLGEIIDAARRARRIRLAEQHLESLDARMLQDIGICRADIAEIVRDGRIKIDIAGTTVMMPCDREATARVPERYA